MSLRPVYGWLGVALAAAWLLAAQAASAQVAYIGNFAGNGSAGAADGLASQASFNGPQQLARLGDGSLLVADLDGNRVRRLTVGGVVSTVAGTGAAVSGPDAGLATATSIHGPNGLAVAPDGETFYFSELNGHKVRRVDPDGSVTTVAGIGIQGGGGDGGPASSARLNRPWGLETGPDGALYIVDANNGSVRRVAANGDQIATPSQTITTAASGFGSPYAVLVNSDGSLVVTEIFRITRVAADGSKTRLAGSAGSSYCMTAAALCGDGGPATSALVYAPQYIVRDGQGGYLFTDTGTMRVRRITAAGIISTVAGVGVACSAGQMCGDGGTAAAAQFASPSGIYLAPDGGLYVADRSLHRIRVISSLPSTAPAGPAGPAGPQGPQGTQGPAGADGAAGTSGSPGANGADGADGARGRSGAAGRNGTAGRDGADGAAGRAGAGGRDGTWNDLVAMEVVLPAEAIMSRPARRTWVRLFVSGASRVQVTVSRNGKVVKRVKRRFKRIGRKRFNMGHLRKGRYQVRVTAVAVKASGAVSASSTGRDSARLVVR